MYIASAQRRDGLQALATAAALARWGTAEPGCEPIIAHSVCKGKFKPWRDGKRQFGCFRHHDIRCQRIRKAGLRDGWERFDQWASPNAHARAKESDEAAEPTGVCCVIDARPGSRAPGE